MDTKNAPNVIFVLTDDPGYGDLSCHGNPVLRMGQAEQALPVGDGATDITFRVALPRGPAQIDIWWHDAAGNRLAGACYLTAERLG